MTGERQPQESDATLVLSGALCVDRAQQVHEQLLACVQAPVAADGTTRVDASAVSRIDTAGLQLLAVAVAEWSRRGRVWQWLAVSPPIIVAARIAGLTVALNLHARGEI